MQSRTVAISLLVHGALAATLFGAATRRAAHRPIAVALSETKKKENAKGKPRPPLAPRPIARAMVARKVADLPRPDAAPAPSLRAAPAALSTALSMSNGDENDGPGGIALPGRQPAAAVAPKVASAVTDTRRRRLQEAIGAGPGEEAPCAEEPSKPEPVFKQEIEYTAQARAEGVEGKLKLRLTVAVDGSVSKVDVLEGVSAELDGAAVGAARLWRFKPAAACGRPVVGTYVVARRFELGD